MVELRSDRGNRSMASKVALLVIDVQYDFLPPTGTLAVKEGNDIIPHVVRLINLYDGKKRLVVATQDWHPAGHGSFASTHNKEVFSMGVLGGKDQVMWPDHCVQGSRGSELHDDLPRDKISKVIRKGINTQVDSYSAFFDNNGESDTGLHDYLTKNEIDTVVICGLATDFCVAFSAIDAIKLGYAVYLVRDAVRGVDNPSGNVDKELSRMTTAGVKIVSTQEALDLA
eukprot:CFRG7372T1